MNKKGKTGPRLLFYIGGLLIMTFGVAISIRSDLGVSPISSIPYTLTCVAGMDMGLSTTVCSIVFIIMQMIILRKDFKLYDLLQLPVSIMFGAFMSFCTGLTVYMPEPGNFAMKIVMMLISTVVVAIGVYMYVSSGYITLPTEGIMIAVVRVWKFQFGSVKRAFDISMVVISAVTCLIFIKELGSVGIGTIISAVLVGTEIKLLTKWTGKVKDKFLGFESVE